MRLVVAGYKAYNKNSNHVSKNKKLSTKNEITNEVLIIVKLDTYLLINIKILFNASS